MARTAHSGEETGEGDHLGQEGAADLVTEMREIRHYYAKGVDARVGVER